MGLFDIYKQGQGTYARVAVAAFLGFFAAFGLFELFSVLEAWDARIAGTVPWNVTVVAIIGAAAAVGIALIINHPKTVDFLIVTEGELRKVSWPSGRQLRQQSLVVIVTCVILGAIIFIADVIFFFMSDRLFLR